MFCIPISYLRVDIWITALKWNIKLFRRKLLNKKDSEQEIYKSVQLSQSQYLKYIWYWTWSFRDFLEYMIGLICGAMLNLIQGLLACNVLILPQGYKYSWYTLMMDVLIYIFLFRYTHFEGGERERQDLKIGDTIFRH